MRSTGMPLVSGRKKMMKMVMSTTQPAKLNCRGGGRGEKGGQVRREETSRQCGCKYQQVQVPAPQRAASKQPCGQCAAKAGCTCRGVSPLTR